MLPGSFLRGSISSNQNTAYRKLIARPPIIPAAVLCSLIVIGCGPTRGGPESVPKRAAGRYLPAQKFYAASVTKNVGDTNLASMTNRVASSLRPSQVS